MPVRSRFFAATKIIDGDAELWWLALEQVVAGNDNVTICLDGRQTDFETRTAAEKQAAYDTIYWTLRAIPEAEQRRKIRNLCSRYGIDLKQLCRREAMTWEQLRQLADDPLVTVGAHTVNHVALGKLPQEQALWEITASRKALEKALGRPVDYFCYPYGDAVSAGAREFRLAQGAGMTARGHHTQGTDLSRTCGPSFRAAEGVAQRRLPEPALHRSLSERRAVRPVEPVPARRRRLIGTVSPRAAST